MRVAHRLSMLALLLTAAVAIVASRAPAQQPAPAASPAPTGVRWLTNLDQAIKVAQQSQKLVLLHFWAPWCKNCLLMDGQVFNQPAVMTAIEQHYVPVKLNADQYRSVAENYGIDSLPTDIILSPNGQVITKFNSPTTASAYVTRMNQIALASRPRSGTVGAAPTTPAANPYAGIAPPSNSDVAPVAPTPQPAANIAPPVGSGPQPAQINNPHVQSPSAAVPANTAPANTAPAAPQDRYTAAPQDRSAAAPQDRYATPPAGDRYAAPAQDRYAGNDAAAPVVPSATTLAAPPQDRYAPPAPATPAVGGTPVIDPYANRQPAAGAGYGSQYAPPPAVQSGPYGHQPSAAVAPTTTQQPPTSHPSSEFGLDGYCPVTLLENQKWTAGDRRFGAVHRGRTYLFTSAEAQKRFMANPDYYAPALSGVDPVLAIDQQQSVPGQRKHGVFFDNQVYLFSNEASLMRFSQNPQKYVEGVRQATRSQDGRVLR